MRGDRAPVRQRLTPFRAAAQSRKDDEDRRLGRRKRRRRKERQRGKGGGGQWRQGKAKHVEEVEGGGECGRGGGAPERRWLAPFRVAAGGAGAGVFMLSHVPGCPGRR